MRTIFVFCNRIEPNREPEINGQPNSAAAGVHYFFHLFW